MSASFVSAAFRSIADYIAHYGAEKTEEWLKGVKANLARKAAGGDRDGAKDIAGGICDRSIIIGCSAMV